MYGYLLAHGAEDMEIFEDGILDNSGEVIIANTYEQYLKIYH